MESQDLESQPEAKFELSLSQMPIQLFQPTIFTLLPTYLLNEVGPSHSLKKPCVECRWHENLNENVRALVILLQIECVDLHTQDMTFEINYKGLNDD